MKLAETNIAGVFVIRGTRWVDGRGRVDVCFEREVFYAHELEADWNRSLLVESYQKGTIRGLHYQIAPNAETKLVKCVSGVIFDVVVDVRPASPTYGKAQWFYLTGETDEMLYIPEGVAHGYQTLQSSWVHYLIAGAYAKDCARGLSWDSPTLAIPWPITEPILSGGDATLPWFTP